MLGSLSHVIRGAAVDAILDGKEQVTKAHLEAVLLDYQAEDSAARARRTRRPTRQRGAA